MARRPLRLLARGSRAESLRIGALLRTETVGGLLLLGSAGVALAWANSPWSDSYFALSDFRLGVESLHLDMSLKKWAADGLLAIFFFVVGLELKREFIAGDLRDPRRAVLPIVAAIAGMAVPAIFYLIVSSNAAESVTRGWAIPAATDIAFALAVLAVVGTSLPSALRTFLLTLAVVDDLLAIIVIAFFYSDSISFPYLVAALLPLVLFGVAVRRGWLQPWLLLPLALTTWWCVHASGIHATVAGVLLGFMVPVVAHNSDQHDSSVAAKLEHVMVPLSAGFAVPIFAFFAAGVDVGASGGLLESLQDPVALGVVTGLVLGKPIGIVSATWLLTKLTSAELDPAVSWKDVVGIASLAGIGFTVSLLIGSLAFGGQEPVTSHVTVAVLAGSLISAVISSVILVRRNRLYREALTNSAT